MKLGVERERERERDTVGEEEERGERRRGAFPL